MKSLNNIISVLQCRFPLEREKDTQAAIALKFKEQNIDVQKEYYLDSKNIPDFFIDGIAIEIKIKGNAMKIYKQCERYCQFDEVKQLILATNRSMGFPSQINGKPCYFINLGKAWL
jgi:hypothetical protein